MKKKKLLLPLAIMSLSCGLAVGALAGCGEEEHVHKFTDWAHDESGHWQICVEDGEKSDKLPHVFGEDGKCECGAEKPAVSTASGQVKLLKLGEYTEDFTGVTIDTGDDDGNEVDYNSQTGVFSITNLQVGKSYTLSISKAGYSTYTTTLEVVKGENTVVGGTKGCILQYDAFTHGMHVGDDWSGNYGTPSKIDKSHVNDAENPYFTIGEGAGDFYVYSKEEYDTVSASVVYKDGLTWGVNDAERGNQAIHLVFENGKASMIRIEKMADGKFKAQWIGGQNWEEGCILGDWDFGSDEAHYNPFSEEIEAKYKETGIELKLVRNGSAVYAYVNGEKMGEQMLPAEYATQKCRVALAAGHVNGGQKIPFSISDSIPEEEFASELTFEKGTLPEGVEVSLDKTEGYKRGDLVTLSVGLTEESVITAINLGNKSILENFEDGKVSFVLTEATNDLTVTVEEKQYVDLTDVAVTGKKYDVTGNSLKEGTVVTLQGLGGLTDIELTVADGKVSKENVVCGTYTAHAEGYKPAEVVIGTNGIEGGITLEYDGFEMLPPNYDEGITDFSQVNEGVIKVNGNGGQSLDIVTKDTFTDVAVAINVKNSVAGVVQGIVLKFEDGKYVLLNFKKDQTLIQYRPECWGMESVFGNIWIEHAITPADIDQFNSADGTVLALVRKGGMLYAFLENRCIAADALPEGYESMKVQVGFFAWDVKANASWQFMITEDLPELTGTAEITQKDFPEGVEGIDATLDKETFTLGDEIELSVTLPEGYLVSALTVNGVSYLDKYKDGKLTFLASKNEIEVSVKVIEGQYADVEANVTGKKFDVTGNALEGKEITLVGQGGIGTVNLTVTDGKITKQNMIQGTYTVEVEGYKSVEIIVGANGIEEAIELVYDEAFELVQNWGTKNLDQQNDGYLKGTNEMESLLTKALYNDVAFTVYLSGEYSENKIDGGNQGIAFRFDGGGYVLLRMEGKMKVQFALPETWWQKDDAAEGANWSDLIFFNESDEYLQAYAAGTLKLTLVREGATFYAFLNDKYIGRQVVNSRYENVGAHVGIYWTGTTNGAEKTWKFEMSKTLPDLLTSVTDGTTDTNGTITFSSATPKYGEDVIVTVTPNAGYVIKSLTVGGKDVTGSVKADQNTVVKYTFAISKETEVVAEFEQATFGNVGVAISGSKGTQAIDLNGTKVTLTNAKAKYEITVADGKITQENVVTGEYTLTAEGYLPKTVTVTENGIADAIVLVYNIFTSAPEAADLTQINEGKVTATGNGGVDLETKEKYTKVTAEAVFDVPDYNGRRYGIALVFGDGKNFRVDFAVQDSGNNILQQTNWNSMMFNWEWVDFPEGYFAERNNNYTEQEIRDEFIAKGLTYKLERDGATVKLYINDVLMKTYTLPESYANQEAQLKFIFDSNDTDGTKGFTFDITVPAEVGEN